MKTTKAGRAKRATDMAAKGYSVKKLRSDRPRTTNSSGMVSGAGARRDKKLRDLENKGLNRK